MWMLFQLTASQGGWQKPHITGSGKKYISTHSLTRRLTLYHCYNLFPKTYFNSQPHKEADCFWRASCFCAWCISTHSLTRRLTEDRLLRKSVICISTHSLTRRLTIKRPYYSGIWTFQLTASQGGWQNFWMWMTASGNFNSQPHKEADKHFY